MWLECDSNLSECPMNITWMCCEFDLNVTWMCPECDLNVNMPESLFWDERVRHRSILKTLEDVMAESILVTASSWVADKDSWPSSKFIGIWCWCSQHFKASENVPSFHVSYNLF